MPKQYKSIFHKISSRTPDYNLDPPDDEYEVENDIIEEGPEYEEPDLDRVPEYYDGGRY